MLRTASRPLRTGISTSSTLVAIRCSVAFLGTFQVVAGNGRRRLLGDGGQAVDAELNLGNASGVAVATNGTLYIADSGNSRVRAVRGRGRS